MNTFISKIVGTEISFMQYNPVDEGGKNFFASDIELKTASRMRPKVKRFSWKIKKQRQLRRK